MDQADEQSFRSVRNPVKQGLFVRNSESRTEAAGALMDSVKVCFRLSLIQTYTEDMKMDTDMGFAEIGRAV